MALASIASAWLYVRSCGEGWLLSYYESVNGIIDSGGSVTSPASYRLLSPYLISLIQDALPASLSGFKWALFIFSSLSLFFSSYFIYKLIEKVTKQDSLAHTLIFLLIFQIGLMDHYPHPWSLLEPGFLAACILAAISGEIFVFIAVSAIGTLNRETAMLYSVVFILINKDHRYSIAKGIAGISVPFAIYLFVRFFTVGNGPHSITLNEVFTINLTPSNLAIFFVPAIIMTACGLTVIPGVRTKDAYHGGFKDQVQHGLMKHAI